MSTRLVDIEREVRERVDADVRRTLRNALEKWPTQDEVNDREIETLDAFASALDRRHDKHGPMILRLIELVKRLPDEDHL
jgi:hypothetical protein